MVHEGQLHDETSAVTLTYSEAGLPPGKSLQHSDFQKFLKRVRNAGHKFRYFMCGEYGESNLRPHYHAIMYGLDFPDREPWLHTGKSKQFRSDTLAELWPHGWALVADANPAAIRYVAGYLQSKLAAENPINPLTGEILTPYQHMSRRPAIAKRWIERHWGEVYATDSVIFAGREMRPPAYYDRWLSEHHPEKWRSVRKARFKEQDGRPVPTAKRYRQQCEAIQARYAPQEQRPGEFIA